MLFDLHLAYFETSGPTYKWKFTPEIKKKLRLTYHGQTGNPFKVVTSKVMKWCRLRYQRTPNDYLA